MPTLDGMAIDTHPSTNGHGASSPPPRGGASSYSSASASVAATPDFDEQSFALLNKTRIRARLTSTSTSSWSFDDIGRVCAEIETWLRAAGGSQTQPRDSPNLEFLITASTNAVHHLVAAFKSRIKELDPIYQQRAKAVSAGGKRSAAAAPLALLQLTSSQQEDLRIHTALSRFAADLSKWTTNIGLYGYDDKETAYSIAVANIFARNEMVILFVVPLKEGCYALVGELLTPIGSVLSSSWTAYRLLSL